MVAVDVGVSGVAVGDGAVAVGASSEGSEQARAMRPPAIEARKVRREIPPPNPLPDPFGRLKACFGEGELEFDGLCRALML